MLTVSSAAPSSVAGAVVGEGAGEEGAAVVGAVDAGAAVAGDADGAAVAGDAEGVGVAAGAAVVGGAVVAAGVVGAGAVVAVGVVGAVDEAGGRCGFDEGEAGGAAEEVAATIPGRVGAPTGRGRPTILGRAAARRFAATGTPPGLGAACSGVPLDEAGGVFDTVGQGEGESATEVACVPEAARFASDAPAAPWVEDSFPKKGSSVAWLAAPTPSSTASAPATTAIR